MGVHFVRRLAPISAVAFAVGLLAPAALAQTVPQRRAEAGVGEAATPPSAVERAAAPEVVAPRLIHLVEAAWPEAAPPRDAVVLLELVIGSDGVVHEAQVVEGAGDGFDESALRASRQFVFTPAMRNGDAVAVRIRYRYEFRVPDTDPARSVKSVENPAARSFPLEEAPADPDTEARRSEVLAFSEQSREQPPPTGVDAAPVPAVEVLVQGESEAERLQRSARAVTVVDLEEARARTASLGAVLSRQEGISVRNTGGLGARSEVSLEGFTGDQVRFFLDGVPLRLAGFSLGVANAPLQFLERIEVYRGVVPVRFGADALGGAINLVSTTDEPGTRAAVSLLGGSFGTQRATAAVAHQDADDGWFVRARGFWDEAKNDYPVTVEIPDDEGRLASARVRRFHDAYAAWGAMLDFGVAERPWARQLMLRAFQSAHDREVQHGRSSMQVPYGEVTYGRRAKGVQLHYSYARERARVEAKVGYTAETTHFEDLARCRYDWRGRCVQVPFQGEINSIPLDRERTDGVWFSRIDWLTQVAPGHQLHVSLAPTHVRQSGRDAAIGEGAYDALRAGRNLTTHVAGMEHHAELWDGTLANVLFGKTYQMLLGADEQLPNGNHRNLQRAELFGGWGNSLRWSPSDQLDLKTSYEYALRLPNTEEIFGDGVLVLENLRLRSERSHNLNLGAHYDAVEPERGGVSAQATGFARWSTDLIRTLFAGGAALINENVPKVTTFGVHGAASWSAPAQWLTILGNATWQDVRNRSPEGSYGPSGDRIPNQPYLLANAQLQLHHRGILSTQDRLRLVWNTGYVHEFFKAWESQGARDSKLVVPSQLHHDVGVLYGARGGATAFDVSFEVSNLTSAHLYDYFGVQKPGRAFYLKVSIELSKEGAE